MLSHHHDDTTLTVVNLQVSKFSSQDCHDNTEGHVTTLANHVTITSHVTTLASPVTITRPY